MINQIHCGKAEEIIPMLSDDSIDCIITSPPYNVNLGNNKFKKIGYDEYKDNQDHWIFINDLRNIFRVVKPKLKRDARVCINIGNRKNGRIPTHSDIINFMISELNYLMYTIIIWNKMQTSNRTAWGSYNSPSFPSFPTPFEYILVFGNKTLKLEHSGISDLEPKEFVDWSLALWSFQPEMKMKKFKHPAMFPEELPKRLIKLFTYENDTILDMYCGSGTTCSVAKKLERNYIGIDISKEYCKTAEERCRNIINKKQIEAIFK